MLSVFVIFTAFAACSKDNNSNTDEISTVSAISLEDSKIKESDAARFIKESYTVEELGLEKVEKEYSFMVASSGIEIEGENYTKVVANVIVKNDVTTDDGKETFSMQTMGEYYIAFKADKVLMKNMESGEYTELENRCKDFLEKIESEAKTTGTEETTK